MITLIILFVLFQPVVVFDVFDVIICELLDYSIFLFILRQLVNFLIVLVFLSLNRSCISIRL